MLRTKAILAASLPFVTACSRGAPADSTAVSHLVHCVILIMRAEFYIQELGGNIISLKVYLPVRHAHLTHIQSITGGGGVGVWDNGQPKPPFEVYAHHQTPLSAAHAPSTGRRWSTRPVPGRLCLIGSSRFSVHRDDHTNEDLRFSFLPPLSSTRSFESA